MGCGDLDRCEGWLLLGDVPSFASVDDENLNCS
jgi:hypothetical protein